jgi:signal transduction histidine kinase
MPSGGRLHITGTTDKGQVRVAFSDTGPGISAEDREAVFQPFFSRRSGGTGLGLAISRRLVAGAGGSLDIEGQPGHGATFVIEFPTARVGL